MKHQHFGKILKELRVQRSLSQAQLAECINYSEKQLCRIEKGKNFPSVDLLHQLSSFFNIDLNEYLKIHFNYPSIISYEQFETFNQALNKGDIQEIQRLVEEYETSPYFKSDENLQLIYYGKALCSYIIDKDYQKSLEYCLTGMITMYPTFIISDISNIIFSNTGYAIINCIACNYQDLGNVQAAKQIYIDLYTNINDLILNTTYSLYRSSDFVYEIYQLAIYNLSVLYCKLEHYNKTIEYADIGIEFAIKENSMRFLADLYFIKFKGFYYLKNYEEARRLYDKVIIFYDLTKQNQKIDSLKSRLDTEFIELFI